MAELSVEDVFQGEPPIEKLLNQLNEVYPLYNPAPDDSLSKIMYLAGQRSVVDYIQSLLQD